MSGKYLCHIAVILKGRQILTLLLLALLHFGWPTLLLAQSDTEFPPGYITYLQVHNGMVTDFSSTPDLYIGGIRALQQVTIIPHVLRAGITAGVFYSSNHIDAQTGPTLSVKLKTFHARFGGAHAGSVANIHLTLEHLWATRKQKLIGGGVVMDLGNLLTLSLTSHKNYSFDTWIFQTEIGIRISRKKRNPVI